MEVKAGFLQTDAGLLPEDWSTATILGVCEPNGLVRGPFGGSLKKEVFVKAGYKVYEQKNAINHDVEIGEYFINDEKFRELKRFEIKENDFIVSCSGTIGKILQIPSYAKPGIVNQALLKIKTNDKVIFDKFFLYIFESDTFQNRVIESQGGAMKNLVGMDIIKKIFIPFPKYHEQRTIATTLSDVDAHIFSLEQVIAKKCDMKQAAMQELLTGKRRLLGFGGEWESQIFEEFARLRTERIDPKMGGEFPFCIELEDIEQGSGHLLKSSLVTDRSSIKSVFYKGDVLFGKLRAYLRKYWLADKDGVCSTEIWPLIPNTKKITNEYLFQLIKTDPFIESASIAYGTHMPRTDWNVVKNFPMDLPKISEQHAIATVLSDMDDEIIALEQQRDKTKAIKQGMMQELLTGRIRLV
jgi:type I restriction enzyme S subunit